MMEKIVQTAGRDSLGEFAPDFAHFNDEAILGVDQEQEEQRKQQEQHNTDR